ncbi:acyltransferase [Colletotrichum truncatum]|uniref:Acyltransferase n=1 Tax=Colletotrichum truncatum TaxID=5467 RepID=A0ACC3YET8_COLTU|nr:acyltransferase [Colletotrichum truncatum]KAF6784916.1 acyltransferase [Colletotrichum truncatum]
MDNSHITWVDKGGRVLNLVGQVPVKISRAGASLVRPRQNSWAHLPPTPQRRRSSVVTAMQFINPFSDSRRSLEFGRYRDFDTDEPAFVATIRSARNSVSSFVNDLHVGEHPWWDKFFQLLLYLRTILFMLLPTFILSPISHFCSRSTKLSPPKRLRPTAYLDGLRGVAAFTVYVYHFTYLWFPKLRQGYGSDEDNMWFWQRTIIKIFHSGRAGVTIFFVVSGYILTTKVLAMIYKRKTDKIVYNICGSALHRLLRLYIPIIAATLLMSIIAYYGYYFKDSSAIPMPSVANNLLDQIKYWFWGILNLINPFNTIIGRDDTGRMAYDGHLWIIPIQVKGSLLVFTLLLMFYRVNRWIHISATTLTSCFLIYFGDWDVALFPIGLLLAELFYMVPPSMPQDVLPMCNMRIGQKAVFCSLKAIRHLWTIIAFFLGIHLMCYPELKGSWTPGFMWLSSHGIPAFFRDRDDRTQLHWNAVGSIVVLLALMYSPPVNFSNIFRRNIRLPWYRTHPDLEEEDKEEMEAASSAATAPRFSEKEPMRRESRSESVASVFVVTDEGEPLLQRLFTARFPQYLGRISYSLYLWHVVVNHTIGMRWLIPAWDSLMRTEAELADPYQAGTSDSVAATIHKAQRSYILAFVWASLINTLVLLWVSDVFYHLVDDPVVKGTRWVGERCFREKTTNRD